MAKTRISEFDIDPANNTDINSINIAEGCAPSGINNAIRQLMSDLKEFQTGAGGDPFNGAVNGTVGATTPNTGAFTTLSASGAFSANGGATLGDASGDALTINSSAVSIPNGLNFDSNTLVIDATNNRVGVNNASPANALDVTGTYISINRAGAVAGYSIKDTTANKSAFFQYTNGTSLFVGAEGTTPIVFANTDSLTERMRIDSSGNVGIGTSSPSKKLQVASDDTYQAILSGSSNINQKLYIGYDTSAGVGKVQAYLEGTGAKDLVLQPSGGNLGLGVTPSAWYSTAKAMQFGVTGSIFGRSGNEIIGVASNAYNDAVSTTSYKYIASGNYATNYLQTTGQHQWFTAPSGTAGNAITFTQAMTLDASGNLGIGTTSPASYVGASGGLVVAQDVTLVNNTTQPANNYPRFFQKSGIGPSISGYQFSVNTGGSASVAPTERMRIDSSGKLLINTTTAAASLAGYVTIDTLGAAGLDIFRSSSTANYSGIRFRDTTNANTYGQIGWDSTGLRLDGVAGTMFFSTSGTERMRIDSSGNLLVGTTTNIINEKFAVQDTGGNSALATKQTGGSSGWCGKFWNNATSGNNSFVEFLTETSFAARGSITYNRAGGTVAYNTTSDSRLKDNIESAPSALSKINSVQIRSYDWKETGNHVDFGVIAQELIQVAPEAVTEGADNEDGTIKSPWAVDTAALVPAMIKAIQELKAEVDSLKAQLNK